MPQGLMFQRMRWWDEVVLEINRAIFKPQYHCLTLFNSLAICDLNVLFVCHCIEEGRCDGKIRLSFRVSCNPSCFRFTICALISIAFLTSLFHWQCLHLGFLLWIFFKSLPLVIYLLFSICNHLFTYLPRHVIYEI